VTVQDTGAGRPAAGHPGAQDTVAMAAATPGRPQPHAELGLTGEEYAAIAGVLGRRPTDAELAIYSVMWSEHCSYKSSRAHLRQFADKAPPSGALLAGIGQNAGVVDIGQGYAVTFKLESHNHPSYVEPFQGAATGVGGIVRDILAMGARPVAVMDALRFGPAGAPDTRRVLPGVVSGISFYGNCLGLPNIGGELAFDACYAGNPLVNALCLGVLRHEDLKLAAASGPGNKVVLFGSRTGPDGIGGASVLASASFGGGRAPSGPASRSATRSWRSCSSSAAWSSTRPAWCWASRISARPAWPARPPSWPQAAGRAWACGSGWMRCRCGTRRWARPRS
jgi:phosphoribosylformylglycinamidine synthase subunit PurL